MDDIDIYRAANVLIGQYGDKAPIHAAMRADELADRGDEEGYAMWKRVIAAIEKLLAVSDTTPLH